MKQNHKFNFWNFAIGTYALLAGGMHLFVASAVLLCDFWGIGNGCTVSQTNLASHILLEDILNFLLSLLIFGFGVFLIIYTLRPVFKKKSAPEELPPFPGENIQKFYASHPVSKISCIVGIVVMLPMLLFCLFFAVGGLFELVKCFFFRSDSMCGVRDVAFPIVFALMSLIPMAGIWKFYSMLKKSVFCVSEEGLQDEHNFIKWSEVERLVCSKTSNQGGIYLELREKKEHKFKWLLRQPAIYLDEYYRLSLPDREAFKQAVRAYIPVEEK